MARILYLTQIDIDDGAVRLLPEECQRTGMSRPLIVTDAGVRAAGVLQMALDALQGLPHAVFDGTPSNPTEAAVRAAVEVYRREGCDGLVAVGGGSSIDLAKGVAIAATHEGPLATYATIEGGTQGRRRGPGEAGPVAAADIRRQRELADDAAARRPRPARCGSSCRPRR